MGGDPKWLRIPLAVFFSSFFPSRVTCNGQVREHQRMEGTVYNFSLSAKANEILFSKEKLKSNRACENIEGMS